MDELMRRRAALLAVKKEYIIFADPEVERICIQHYSSDGIGVTMQDAARPTTIALGIFQGNTVIETFNELQYFVNVTNITGGANNENGNGAFRGCTSLLEITFPPSLVTINNCAFYGCTSLVNVYGGTITTVMNYAFKNCSQLEYIDLAHLSIAYRDAFCNTKLPFDLSLPSMATFSSYGQFSNTQITKILSLGTITTIPAGANNASTGVFANCKSLTDVTLPSTLTSIQQYAFYGCTSFRSISFTSGITSIGRKAFEAQGGDVYDADIAATLDFDLNVPNLTSIGFDAFDSSKIQRISNLGKLTSIPDNSNNTSVFTKCKYLLSAVLPSTLVHIGSFSFNQCSNLKTVTVSGTPSVTEIARDAFSYCTSLESVTGLENCTYIGYQAFLNCTSIKKYDFSAPISTIGDKAFYNQGGETYNADIDAELEFDIDLSNITTLPVSAFYRSKVKNVLSLGSITTIAYASGGYACFKDCKYLRSVVMPSTCTSLNSSIFYGDSNLSSINLEHVTASIGQACFRDCISLPSEMTIGAATISNSAFRGCSSLSKIILPNAATIDQYAFAECKHSYVDIGENCTSIGNYAFISSNATLYVAERIFIIRATEPPTLGTNNFRARASSGWKYDSNIYVPYSADHSVLDAYKAATNWSAFASRIHELDENGNITT